MIEMGQLVNQFHRSEIRVMQKGGEERRQEYLTALWKLWLENEEYRVRFAEDMNNAVAQGLCFNGFIFIPYGSIRPTFSDEGFQKEPSYQALIEKYVEILSTSGFI